MYVNPGELKKKIQIIKINRNTYNRNGIRQEQEETVVRECWAKVTNTSGSELIKSGQTLAEAKKRFLIRWTDTPVDESMVVRYLGQDHEIVYLNPYGDSGEYLEIWTELAKGSGA